MSNESAPIDLDSLPDQIQLLVEGELSTAERRTVIEQIRCDATCAQQVAFAFLEQQKIRNVVRQCCQGLQSANQTHDQNQSPEPVTLVSHRRSWWKPIASLAASVFVAFAFGMNTGKRMASGRLDEANEQIADTSAPENDIASESQDNNKPDTLVAENDYKIVGYVKWQSDEGLRLSPVFDGTADDRWLKEHPPQVDQQVQRAMSRAGWQMEPARRLVSVNLASGDKFTIPMDDVRYRYVGQKFF